MQHVHQYKKFVETLSVINFRCVLCGHVAIRYKSEDQIEREQQKAKK